MKIAHTIFNFVRTTLSTALSAIRTYIIENFGLPYTPADDETSVANRALEVFDFMDIPYDDAEIEPEDNGTATAAEDNGNSATAENEQTSEPAPVFSRVCSTRGIETIDGMTIEVERTDVTPHYESSWNIVVTENGVVTHSWSNVDFYYDEYADDVIKLVHLHLIGERPKLARSVYYD